jgi:hypothetical protein
MERLSHSSRSIKWLEPGTPGTAEMSASRCVHAYALISIFARSHELAIASLRNSGQCCSAFAAASQIADCAGVEVTVWGESSRADYLVLAAP